MGNESNKPFLAGDWLVSPPEGLLTRGDDVERLEPKTMEVLVYLAGRAGDVVTRGELERDVWRGAVVGYDAVTATILKLRKAMRDDARQPRIIATIPKRGYKLVAPIRYPENSEDDQASITVEQKQPVKHPFEETQPSSSEPRSKTSFLLIAVAVVLALGLVLFLSDRLFSPAPEGLENKTVAVKSTGPSIAVLPFEYLGGQSSEGLLADGITEDIITDLSKLSNLLVIASFTSSQYKGTRLAPEEIGKELNVRYLLKGSIRRIGESVRVNAQLVDLKTGFNAWAQRYDGSLSEVFALQDAVTQRIVESLAIKMSNKEKQYLQHRATENLQAYDLFQEGQRLFKLRTRTANDEAIRVYRQAIETDPGFGRAYGGLAVALATAVRDRWTDSPAETMDRALEMAKKAVELDSVTPQPHWALGYVYMQRREFDNAEYAALRTIEIAPNYADGLGLIGIINAWQGNAQKALKYNRRAIRLNPYYTSEYLIPLGIAYYTLGQYDLAIEKLRNALDRNINNSIVAMLLAASYVSAGELDEAKWLIAQLKVYEPTISINEVEKTLPVAKFKYRDKLFDDLRKAGMP